MREALFLKQNKEKWRFYEQAPTNDPDELADRFVQLTDDLAYARTFYPRSKTVDYLNGLTTRFHLAIYKNKKEKDSRFLNFWTIELPLVLAKHRWQLFYAFLIFSLSILIGIISARYDHGFLKTILGSEYVNMTLDNIDNRNPFGVYKNMEPVGMFFMIALNNIWVACKMFAGGITFGIYTGYGLFFNGVMVGSFEYFFFSRDLGWESITVVMLHGVLELAAIVVAGAAGLVLAKGLFFPKTLTRWQSLALSARDAIKIIMGLFPFFLVAAFIEGMLTRTIADTYTKTANLQEGPGMPIWLAITIVTASLLFVIYYFIIYPLIVYRRAMKMEVTESIEQFS